MLRNAAIPAAHRCVGVVLTLCALFALACGGGGSGDSSSAGGDTSSVSATGSTSIFLTDAPSDLFDQILVTIRSVVLIGEDGQITIFSGRETVDLKDLENFSDLFVYAGEVPVGRYNKIRLCVTEVTLIDGDRVIDVDPPANCKIDLLPRDSFTIRDDVNLVIELDMDAKKSIHTVGTGAGKYKFRPVIFVTIRESLPPRKLARVHGVITEIIDDTQFELCSTLFVATRTSSSKEDDDEGGIGDRHRCMTVETDADTGVFDENGDPVGVDSLMEKDEVTVVGAFHMIDENHDDMMAEQLSVDGVSAVSSHRDHHLDLAVFAGSLRDALEAASDSGGKKDKKDTDKDTDSDKDKDTDSDKDTDTDTDGGDRPRPPRDEIVLLAYVIEAGPPGTFLHLKGVIESELDNRDEFDFALEPRQGFGEDSVVTALLQDGTRIFSKQGVEVGEDEIIPETNAKIDGVFAKDSAGTFYKTALLVLDLELDSAELLRGEVVSADSEKRQLEFDAEGTDECVDVPEEAEIFLVSQDQDGATTEEGDFSDLAPGLRADVFGDFKRIGGCFVAETIIGFPADPTEPEPEPEPEPDTCDDANPCSTGEFCARPLGTCSGVGTCTPQCRTCVCPAVFDPVCGCDGQTYENACVAGLVSVSVEKTGICN